MSDNNFASCQNWISICSFNYYYTFRCSKGLTHHSRRNHTAAALSSSADQGDFRSVFSDPIIYLAAIVIFCLMVILALSIFICTIHKRRPRIKKRIIVNKNVTPLTYRPQQPGTEHCEITIENCCNMNVCETVRSCFSVYLKKKVTKVECLALNFFVYTRNLLTSCFNSSNNNFARVEQNPWFLR